MGKVMFPSSVDSESIGNLRSRDVFSVAFESLQ